MKTSIVNNDPLVLYQKIVSFSDEKVIENGINEAMELIENIIKKGKRFNIVLDFIELEKTNRKIEIHKKWSMEFKQNEKVRNNVQKIAIVGKDGPQFSTEKDFMENEKMMFFNEDEKQEALNWVKML